MKDITIPLHSLKQELKIWSLLFVIVYIANIFSIFKYETPFSEFYSSLGYVFMISLVIYLLLGVVRLLVVFVKSFFSKNKS